MDRKIAKALKDLSEPGSDLEVKARNVDWLEAWLSKQDEENVVRAAVELESFAIVALARPGLLALAHGELVGWALLKDWIKASAAALLACHGWRRARGIRAPIVQEAHNPTLSWAAAYSLQTAEAGLLSSIFSKELLTEYDWFPSPKTQSAVAQFCVNLQAYAAACTPVRYVPAGTLYDDFLSGRPEERAGAMRILLDFHYSQMGKPGKTTAFLTDPFTLIPFECMTAARIFGLDLFAAVHPMLWFPQPSSEVAASEHGKWLDQAIRALRPWIERLES